MTGNLHPKVTHLKSKSEHGSRRVAGEKLSRAMVKSITNYAVVLTDPEGIIISLNKGAELIFGYQENELAGKSIAVFYPRDTLASDGPQMNLQEALVNNNYHIKGRRIKKDGTLFLANVQYTALYDDERQLLGYTKIVYELSGEQTDGENTEKIKVSVGANISFRKLIENSYEGISLVDESFKTIYRSRSAEKINGWENADRDHRTMPELIHPDDVADMQKIISEVRGKPGTPITCTFRAKHKNGHYIWLECVFTNMLADEAIGAIVCNFRDITEKKADEERLQHIVKELTDYKYALDQSAIVAITDQKGIIKHVNQNFCKISKYSAEELIGQDHRIINSGYHDKSYIRNLWTTIANGKIWRGELKNKAKDGSFYWVDTTIVPFLDQKKKPYQYLAIRSDITERKLIEERVIESEKFIKTITDNLPALIAYWSADLHCLFANKPYCDWFEKQPAEMLGVSKHDIIDKEEFEATEKYISGVLAGKAQSFERNFLKPTGEKIHTQTQYIPDKDGETVIGFYSLIYDITGVKLAEREVIKKTEQIENIMESITDGFVAFDENLCYTYANKTIGEMLGCEPESLIGKNIWELFPDVIGSSTYHAIQTAFVERKYICNEDYYAPLNLWQENRVYPSATGISMFIRDISERKNKEKQNALIAEIALIFNEQTGLKQALNRVLEHLVNYSDFIAAEFWLVGADKQKISRAAKFAKTEKMRAFQNQGEVKSLVKGEELIGLVWETRQMQFWDDNNENTHHKRLQAVKKAGLKRGYAFPLIYNEEIIGVLGLAGEEGEVAKRWVTALFENFSARFGAEIKRKQLEEELSQIFNVAPDVICVAGVDGYFRKVNPAMIRLFGYTELELLNRPFVDFVYFEDKAKTVSQFRDMAEGKGVSYFENRFLTATGKLKWLAWTTSNVTEEGLIFAVAKDITEQKGLEDTLKKANSLARIGAWEVDLTKGIILWSDMTREIHEAEPGFVPSLEEATNFYKAGADRETITQMMTEAAKYGTSADTELQIVTVKGKTKWVRVIIEAEFSGKKCVKLYGSFQDIDARKKAELAVTEVLEDRNTILESIGDAFFAVDSNWVVTYWNNMAEKVLGKPKELMLNNNLWEVFHESVGSNSYQNYHFAIENQKAMHFEDFYPPLAKWYEISAYPSPKGLAVYFKDITDRKASDIQLKELNASLQQQTRELATSNAELEQFAFVASHDLQEPLRMITSFMTMIERKYNDIIDDKGRQYIHFAVDGAKRMRQIILDLLEFSKVKTLEDQPEEISLDKAVREILALYRKQMEEKHARVIFANLPVVHTSKTPLRQVLQNLISNSLKYSVEGTAPEINISCSETESQWEIAVQDNGIGIEPQYFDKIFIIFQRLHNKESYSGTGMGLAIAKRIVENLGGKIWVESAKGKGSTFYFTVLKKNHS